MEEKKVLIGVCKILDGLVDVMATLPETTNNVRLWTAIGTASQMVKQIINDEV
jgi:hypothetical protein